MWIKMEPSTSERCLGNGGSSRSDESCARQRNTNIAACDQKKLDRAPSVNGQGHRFTCRLGVRNDWYPIRVRGSTLGRRLSVECGWRVTIRWVAVGESEQAGSLCYGEHHGVVEVCQCIVPARLAQFHGLESGSNLDAGSPAAQATPRSARMRKSESSNVQV